MVAGRGNATGPGRVDYRTDLSCFHGSADLAMVVSGMSASAENLSEVPDLLKAMIAALSAENAKISASLRARDLLAQALRVRIVKLQKQKFGASSEKIEREIEQLELALEDLQVAEAEAGTVSAVSEEEAVDETATSPEKKPRERREFYPGDSCPECGGAPRVIGKDVSERLDMIAAQMKVVEIAAPWSTGAAAR